MRRSIPPDCGSSSEKRIILITLALVDRQRPAFQIHVLDPQPHQLRTPQSRPVLEPRRQGIAPARWPRLLELLENPLRLSLRQHHRNPRPRLAQFHVKNRVLHLTDMLEKERQGIERLLLCRKRPKACRPFGQERSDVPRRGEQAGGACESISAVLILHHRFKKKARRSHSHQRPLIISKLRITRRPRPVAALRRQRQPPP